MLLKNGAIFRKHTSTLATETERSNTPVIVSREVTRVQSEEVVQVYGICIRTLHLPVISVTIIGVMRLSHNERVVSEQ